MTDERMALVELLQKSGDGDFLRAVAEAALQISIETGRRPRAIARWLLMMRDRGDDDALQITQSLLGEMLGVQRPTVTNAARTMEHAGLIARGRRQVSILDRPGLVAASCECYQLVRARIAFHLPKTYA
jgi:CRP-like cAMP-binding protein